MELTEAPVIYYARTDSTMLEARRYIEAFEKENGQTPVSGTVIRAGYQSAGRGRINGRNWESAKDESLLFTMIFSADDLASRLRGKPVTLLPLLCGLAVSKAVEQMLLSEGLAEQYAVAIKWPNDVLVNGKKLCGILCESSGSYVYAGIGLNLAQKSFPLGMRRPAVSLRMLMTEKHKAAENEADKVLILIRKNIEAAFKNENWQSDIQSRLFKLNKKVEILPGLAEEIKNSENEWISGVLKGISPDGAIIIDAAEGLLKIMNGELRV